MKCKVCGKEPHELSEYITAAISEGMTPAEYVREEEGTYNPETELFYCSPCYVKVGMPLGKA